MPIFFILKIDAPKYYQKRESNSFPVFDFIYLFQDTAHLAQGTIEYIVVTILIHSELLGS